MTDWIAASYGSVVTALVVVAAYALAYPTLIAPRFFKDSNESGALADIDGFLTAKKSQSRWRIAFRSRRRILAKSFGNFASAICMLSTAIPQWN